MKYAEFKKLKKQMEAGPLSEQESKEEESEEKLTVALKQKAAKVIAAAKTAETQLKPVED